MQAIKEGHKGHVLGCTKGSVYSMMECNPTQPPSLVGQIATINHHLSADLQATRDSLKGLLDATVLNSCLILSILPSPASAFLSVDHAASLSAPDQTLCHSRSRGNDLDAAISPEPVRRLILL